MRDRCLAFFFGLFLSFHYTAGQSTITIYNLSSNNFFGFYYGTLVAIKNI